MSIYKVAMEDLDYAGGVQLGGFTHTWRLQGKLVIVVTDPVQNHGSGAHAAPTMAEGSTWWTINGLSVCREGHQATCGHATTGQPWALIPD